MLFACSSKRQFNSEFEPRGQRRISPLSTPISFKTCLNSYFKSFLLTQHLPFRHYSILPFSLTEKLEFFFSSGLQSFFCLFVLPSLGDLVKLCIPLAHSFSVFSFPLANIFSLTFKFFHAVYIVGKAVISRILYVLVF